MTVGTLIKRLSNYPEDYVVKLHHREGEEVLFHSSFVGHEVVVLETESDNDMAEEISARFELARANGTSDEGLRESLKEDGIIVAMVREYLGDEYANRLE